MKTFPCLPKFHNGKNHPREPGTCPSIVIISLLVSIITWAPSGAAATKVAIIADQATGSGAKAVLELIHDEGADILLIQGDLGYETGRVSQWDDNLTNALGRNFPVLTLIGNHENAEWPQYQRLISERIDRANGLSCNGTVGVKASCVFDNLHVVQVARGIQGVPSAPPKDNYDDFIRSSFSNSDMPWKICAWHKNQKAMQVATKTDETGWEIYDACLDVGAMIVMGHAHTYSRTHLMSDFRNQTIAHTNNTMLLEPGRSLAVVSGLGGFDIKPQANSGDWFASAYTLTQGATHGALFCTLGQTTGECYFKAINGAIPDSFNLEVNTDTSTPGSPSPAPYPEPTQPGVFSRTDKNEYRWVARETNGQWANRWISEQCASMLGSPRYSGSWSDLMELAPSNGSIDDPCNAHANTESPSSNTGYVFSRTDKSEYRWIDSNDSGQIGSVWIDQACALRLGGSFESGDWGDLMSQAPALDTVQSPCNNISSPPNSQTGSRAGYVFSRTDTNEFRWVDQDEFGTWGNVWIDQDCVNQLGGITATGDWGELRRVSPGFNAIANPCH